VKYPALSNVIETITLQYKEKMWHQLSFELITYMKDKAFDANENTDLLELYDEMVKGLSSKLNPIRYAIVTILVSRQHKDIEQSINFLDEAPDLMGNEMLSSCVGLLKLRRSLISASTMTVCKSLTKSERRSSPNLTSILKSSLRLRRILPPTTVERKIRRIFTNQVSSS